MRDERLYLADMLEALHDLENQDVLPERIGATIVTAPREHAGALESGALLSVDGWRSRVRILPLNR